ncbi:MAG: hypothetical protein KGO94_01315 [Alphaproteobacteria bacterium]|nr:hypothetical protein [Alphaproteobacteria bacterium]
MSWLALAMALVKLTSGIITTLNEKKLIEAGAAKAALAALEKANAAISRAQKARQNSNADLELHPDRLRDTDGFKRPGE